MTEISRTTSPRGQHAATIGRGFFTSRRIDPPGEARLCQDTVAMDWHRLRTIVDAVLRRAAASNDEATAIAATTVVANTPSPAEQEPIHG